MFDTLKAIGMSKHFLFAYYALAAILPILAWWRGGRRALQLVLVLAAATILVIYYLLGTPEPHGFYGLGMFFYLIVPGFWLTVGLLLTGVLAWWQHFRKR